MLEVVRSLSAPLVARLTEECQHDEEHTCALVLMALGASPGEGTAPQRAEQAAQMLAAARSGCAMLEPISCEFIIDAYGEARFEQRGIMVDLEQLEALAGEACDLKLGSICERLAAFFYTGTSPGRSRRIIADPARAALYQAKACEKKRSDACFWGAMLYASRDVAGCMKLFREHVDPRDEQVRSYKRSPWPSLTSRADQQAFCQRSTTTYKPERAAQLAQLACALKDEPLAAQACSLATSFD
jgi:TPR repeat protein